VFLGICRSLRVLGVLGGTYVEHVRYRSKIHCHDVLALVITRRYERGSIPFVFVLSWWASFVFVLALRSSLFVY
jgi:hypothetical protein